jgi:hypothetical protein
MDAVRQALTALLDGHPALALPALAAAVTLLTKDPPAVNGHDRSALREPEVASIGAATPRAAATPRKRKRPPYKPTGRGRGRPRKGNGAAVPVEPALTLSPAERERLGFLAQTGIAHAGVSRSVLQAAIDGATLAAEDAIRVRQFLEAA